MNPIGASILAVLVAVVLFATRRWALLAMMAGVLYLTQGQQVEVGGINLYAMRFLELAGFVRVVVRKEIVFRNFNIIDKSLLLLCAYTSVVYALRASENRIFMLAGSVDTIFSYFAFRGLVGNLEDFRNFLRSFVLLLVPFVILVGAERVTHRNPFAFMGGVVDWEWLRDGKLRCSGSFRHPSLLGGFAAAFVPLYMGLACLKQERKRALLGIALCLALIIASNSGGPKVALAFACLGWSCWVLRGRMQYIRRGAVAGVIMMDLVMKAPVWYLPTHFAGLTGGDTYHRCQLIEESFNHLGNWWFAGVPLAETRSWFPHYLVSTGGADITNQFLFYGIHTGLGAMALFILLLVVTYKRLGQALSAVRSAVADTEGTEFLLWGMGVMLAVHLANWWGIHYWDQTYVIWLLHLAALSNFSDIFIAFGESQLEQPSLGNCEVVEPTYSPRDAFFVSDN